MKPARSGFEAAYGYSPTGEWFGPGRVNLIGEHTDYNDGFTLPFAIERGITLAAARTDREAIRFASADRPAAEIPVADLAPRALSDWIAYPGGVLWVLAGNGVELGGLDIFIESDLPIGSGLSSSAALESATAVMVRDLFAGPSDPLEIALAGQRAEHEVAHVPCGLMDQVASVCGVADHVVFFDTRSNERTPIPTGWHEAGLGIVVMDTRTERALADGAYAERRASCESAAAKLGVTALRDLDSTLLEQGRERLTEREYRRARHVVTEDERTVRTVELMRAGRGNSIGELMCASHTSLRDDYEVVTAELDACVNAAMECGALGARMTGAGFGGCAIALADLDTQARLMDEVPAKVSAAGLTTPALFAVTPSDGARRL